MSDDFPHQAMSIPSAPAGKMSLFPIGEGASMDSICNTSSSLEEGLKFPGLGEGTLEGMRRGGGALGRTITEDLANVTGQLVTKEAGGDNLKLEQMSAGDLGNLKTPTAQGDLQTEKGLGMGIGAKG